MHGIEFGNHDSATGGEKNFLSGKRDLLNLGAQRARSGDSRIKSLQMAWIEISVISRLAPDVADAQTGDSRMRCRCDGGHPAGDARWIVDIKTGNRRQRNR